MSANKILPGFGFHHINLRVSNFEASYKFYTEVMGMTEVCHWDEGEFHFSMLNIGDGGIVELATQNGNEVPNGRYNHFAFKVDDSERAYNLAIAGGAKSKMVPTEVTLPAVPNELHLKVAFVLGPDGEEIELFQTL